MPRAITLRLWDWLTGLLLVIALSGICYAVFQHLGSGWDWSKPWQYRRILIQGWQVTILLTLGSIIGSLLVGTLLLLGLRSPFRSLQWSCRLFLEFIRETPLLVQLLVGYFLVFAPLLSTPLSDLGWDDKLIIGMVLLSLFEGAYLGEIFRGGIESIPKTQWDSALALGFTRRQTYVHVIIPQALRRVLPALAGQIVSLIKDSSLLSVIGVQEFAYQARAYTAKTYGGIEAYLPLALGYLILTAPIAILSHRLERRLRHEA
jgi:polar amino acid transport system permease protein